MILIRKEKFEIPTFLHISQTQITSLIVTYFALSLPLLVYIVLHLKPSLHNMQSKIHFSVVLCALLIATVTLSTDAATTAAEWRCGSDFCDNIRVSCIPPGCGPDEVALIKPELCRCCPQCYPAN